MRASVGLWCRGEPASRGSLLTIGKAISVGYQGQIRGGRGDVRPSGGKDDELADVQRVEYRRDALVRSAAQLLVLESQRLILCFDFSAQTAIPGDRREDSR